MKACVTLVAAVLAALSSCGSVPTDVGGGGPIVANPLPDPRGDQGIRFIIDGSVNNEIKAQGWISVVNPITGEKEEKALTAGVWIKGGFKITTHFTPPYIYAQLFGDAVILPAPGVQQRELDDDIKKGKIAYQRETFFDDAGNALPGGPSSKPTPPMPTPTPPPPPAPIPDKPPCPPLAAVCVPGDPNCVVPGH